MGRQKVSFAVAERTLWTRVAKLYQPRQGNVRQSREAESQIWAHVAQKMEQVPLNLDRLTKPEAKIPTGRVFGPKD